MNDQVLLDAVLQLAQEAGEKIMDIYKSDFAVQAKDDKSPLTQADLAAHAHIVAGLEKLEPRLPILSEESAEIPFETRKNWSAHWLVDPLDGTKEFIKRNGEFTVNIALIEMGLPILGVVHVPALGVSYAAAQDLGAFKIANGQRGAIRTRRLPATPVYLVSRSHVDPETEKLLARLPKYEAQTKGSSLKFCLIAEGAADFYPRTGPTSEWDTAAGQCIVEQAGGAVWRLDDLTPLFYNEKESLLNPAFAVTGDLRHPWSALLRN